ncbi:hypothetical protein R6Q59_019193 [Mikania micrantha]
MTDTSSPAVDTGAVSGHRKTVWKKKDCGTCGDDNDQHHNSLDKCTNNVEQESMLKQRISEWDERESCREIYAYETLLSFSGQ